MEISLISPQNKILAFAGLEPSIIQSGTLEYNGKMIKHSSGLLKYAIMNIAMTIIITLRNVLKVNAIELLYPIFVKNLLELFTL